MAILLCGGPDVGLWSFDTSSLGNAYALEAARTFASSAFKELYNQCQLSKGHRILNFVRDYVNWLHVEGFADDVAKEINRKLEKKYIEGFTVNLYLDLDGEEEKLCGAQGISSWPSRSRSRG